MSTRRRDSEEVSQNDSSTACGRFRLDDQYRSISSISDGVMGFRLDSTGGGVSPASMVAVILALLRMEALDRKGNIDGYYRFLVRCCPLMF